MIDKPKRKGGLLKNWYLSGIRVVGDIYGDSKWPDGTNITTSPVVRIDTLLLVLETHNTIYTLEKRKN